MLKMFGLDKRSSAAAPEQADATVALERASQITLAALQHLDAHSSFLGLFGSLPEAAVKRLPDGAEAVELADLGLRVTLYKQVFKLEALGIDPTRMAILVAGLALKHTVGAEPDWQAMSREGEPAVMEGSVPIGPVSLLVTIREGEQSVAGRRGPGSSLWIALGPHRDAATPKDDVSAAARAALAQGESQRLGGAKVLFGGLLMQLRLDDRKPLTKLMEVQPLDPPLGLQGRNGLGQMVYADLRRGLWAGVTDERFDMICVVSDPAPVIAALRETFQFFAGDVGEPVTQGEATSFILKSSGGAVFDLTVKPEATPFKDAGGRVVPGVTVTLSRRAA